MDGHEPTAPTSPEAAAPSSDPRRMLRQTTDRLAQTHEHPAYEWSMAALAVLSVAVLFVDQDAAWARIANLVVYALFVVDYVTRLAVADDRRRFVRGNVVDLVAIMPADMLRLARVARLARLARAGSLLWRVSANLRAVLLTNGLGWVLLVASGTILAGAGAVFVADPTFETFGDALWWSIVTSTTVGYGDLSPTTALARGVAVIVMFVGIGTIGMLTGSIATYFTRLAATGEEAEADPAAVVELDGARVQLDAEQAAHVRVTLRGLGVL